MASGSTITSLVPGRERANGRSAGGTEGNSGFGRTRSNGFNDSNYPTIEICNYQECIIAQWRTPNGGELEANGLQPCMEAVTVAEGCYIYQLPIVFETSLDAFFNA
jgi:hypothetical protein